MATPNSLEKLQFSGHETFPLRQLWLRKAYLAVAEAGNDASAAKKIFSDDAAVKTPTRVRIDTSTVDRSAVFTRKLAVRNGLAAILTPKP